MATKNPMARLLGVLLLILLLAGGAGVLIWLQRVPVPTAQFRELPTAIGTSTQLSLFVQAARGGVRSVRVALQQGEATHTLSELSFADAAAERDLRIDVQARDLGLREEDALLQVYATDGSWRLRASGDPVLSLPVRVDLTPPRLELVSFARYPEQGGSGLAVVRAEADAKVQIQSGGGAYPTYPAAQDAQLHIGLYPIGPDQSVADPILAVAFDAAGNSAQVSLPVRPRLENFRRGNVDVDTAWLQRKLPELLPGADHSDPAQYAASFLHLNKDLRAEAATTKQRIAQRSAPSMLWTQPFQQPRNTQVFSNFAETRDYRINGEVVDTQVHLGFDLASTERAPVPAANAGRVLFASPLNIYGNTVILDHGMGLNSLYAHLSTIDVTVDQDVPQGAILGLSGSTGLAVGDHVHFEVLLHGVPVNPLQWWDAMWIEDHVRQPLREAGIALAESTR
jgi:murein DD-endopeptidase MepM/ murein hydrolase activator NlpD